MSIVISIVMSITMSIVISIVLSIIINISLSIARHRRQRNIYKYSNINEYYKNYINI